MMKRKKEHKEYIERKKKKQWQETGMLEGGKRRKKITQKNCYKNLKKFHKNSCQME
ncbi:MAG: hypothetical protein HFI57_13620 [Lachnospiraceae bacterium]|nr:hypothetical protein [Lachnospiraceae bacterium]